MTADEFADLRNPPDQVSSYSKTKKTNMIPPSCKTAVLVQTRVAAVFNGIQFCCMSFV